MLINKAYAMVPFLTLSQPGIRESRRFVIRKVTDIEFPDPTRRRQEIRSSFMGVAVNNGGQSLLAVITDLIQVSMAEHNVVEDESLSFRRKSCDVRELPKRIKIKEWLKLRDLLEHDPFRPFVVVTTELVLSSVWTDSCYVPPELFRQLPGGDYLVAWGEDAGFCEPRLSKHIVEIPDLNDHTGLKFPAELNSFLEQSLMVPRKVKIAEDYDWIF